ncbi:hypothetical protein [Fusobacterium sp.]|uniref:hypothetical protein n=1 Tax=Fusobacterium sp. TaxID=68766 RepID=UPI002607D3C6|nr:hypothetical protein [Fusobacterium sp.]
MYVYEVKTFNIIEHANTEKYLNNPNYIISDKIFCNPIKDKITGKIREATREEICARGNISILENGEYFENGKIIKVDYNQELGYLKPTWNSKVKQWIEQATKDEQLEYCKQEILKNTRELLVFEKSGFSNDELQAKIDVLVEKHRILSEDIARDENLKY